MKKDLKESIKKIYAPPIPQRKDSFLYSLNYPKINWYDFLLSQIGYIRKTVWVASFLLYLTAIFLSTYLDYNSIKLLWPVSALLPYLALITITETARSAVYGLSELEMTTRYNLRGVLMSRMAVIGTGNIIFLLMMIPVLGYKINLNLFHIGIYLLVPYLLTSFLSFWLVNKVRTKDFSYYCVGISVVISCCELFLSQLCAFIYSQQYFILWLLTSFVLTILLVKEIKKLINHSEALIWN